MSKLNLKEQLNKQLVVAIHCTSLEQIDIVLSFVARLGYTTQSKHHWIKHENNTVCFINQSYKTAVCGHLNTAKNLGYKLYKPSQFEELVSHKQLESGFINWVNL